MSVCYPAMATFSSPAHYVQHASVADSASEFSKASLIGDLAASMLSWIVATLIMTGLLTRCILQIRDDYAAFIALGPGGNPSTGAGYLKIKLLGLFALKNPYLPPSITTHHSWKGYLNSLPKRPYERPEVRGIVPHRQVTQRASKEAFVKLIEMVEGMATKNELLAIGTSCFEKHGTGLFTVSPIRRTCGGEVCHAHAVDGSLHMTLHPADARIVLEAGWGERHPLARGGWFERFVPRGFILVYSPSTDADFQVIKQIIKAAVWNVGGDEAVRAGK